MGNWLHWLIETFFMAVLLIAVWSVTRDLKRAYRWWRNHKGDNQ